MIEGSLVRPDATLRFEKRGIGSDILLLHAGGERRRVWRPVMNHPSMRDFHCIAYDQREHGESDGRSGSSITAFGDDVAAMVAELNLPVIVGASLGGFAALFALADPAIEEKVAGLMLVDVIPYLDPERVRRFLAPMGMDKSPLVDDILGRQDRMQEIASNLSLPVSLIRAGKGGGITDVDTQRFKTLVPQAQISAVPGAGHLIAKEKPAELALLLEKFVISDNVRKRRESA